MLGERIKDLQVVRSNRTGVPSKTPELSRFPGYFVSFGVVQNERIFAD